MKSIARAMVALLWVPLLAQEGAQSGALTGLLLHNPALPVDFTNMEPPVRGPYSAQRLANSWNHLVEQLRANEARFSSSEEHALTRMLLHIQGGLSLAGFEPAGKNAVPGSRQDLVDLAFHTSGLCTALEAKQRQNPGLPQFRKLVRTARALDQEARRLSPTVPVSRLAR